MRFSLSLFLTFALIVGCSNVAPDTQDNVAETNSESLTPVAATAQQSNMLDVILARPPKTSHTQIEGLASLCQAPGLSSAITQATHTLINASLNSDGRLTLRTAIWNDNAAVYRDFTLKGSGARLEAKDGAISIRGDKHHVEVMEHALDVNGDVVFSGQPSIELPFSVVCTNPQGAIRVLKNQTGDTFTSAAVGLDEHVQQYRSYMKSDPRFDELLDACGEATDNKLIAFGYADRPRESYQGQIFATTIIYYPGGAEFMTMFLPHDKMRVIQGEDFIRLSSIGETGSGHSKGIMESGPSSESNSFENAEAESQFGCENPRRAASIINGAKRWIGEGLTEPRADSLSNSE